MAAAAMIAISVIGGLIQYKTAQDAASEQESIARQNAAMQASVAEQNARAVELENREEARRMSEAQEKERSASLARAAASGVRVGEGSVADWLDAQLGEHTNQLDWLKKSGERQAENIRWGGAQQSAITRREGSLLASQTRAGGFGSLFGSLGSAYSYGKGTYW